MISTVITCTGPYGVVVINSNDITLGNIQSFFAAYPLKYLVEHGE